MLPTGSPASDLHSAYEAVRAADREMLVDIDFFDANGRWNPKSVVFCAAEDPARAKRLWTRCFRGVMALHGKLWAKNYLRSHFEGKPESNALLQQIRQNGFIDNRVFRETVLRCTLLYEDLKEVTAGRKTTGDYKPAMPSIIDIDKLASHYLFQIDWRQCAKDKQFDWVTPKMAHNIKRIIGELKPSKEHNEIVNNLTHFIFSYEQWYRNPPDSKKEGSDLLKTIHKDIEEKKYIFREGIAQTIFSALDDYSQQLESGKLIQEKITSTLRSHDDDDHKSKATTWSLSKAKANHKIASEPIFRRVSLVSGDPQQVSTVVKSASVVNSPSLPDGGIDADTKPAKLM
ncbi:MAG: hypothetical protein RLZ64_1997 [Pseudomonadota bacterium]